MYTYYSIDGWVGGERSARRNAYGKREGIWGKQEEGRDKFSRVFLFGVLGCHYTKQIHTTKLTPLTNNMPGTVLVLVVFLLTP